MSNQPGILIPPFTVIGMLGAFGKMKLVSACDLSIPVCEITCGNHDQPSPVSPRPCKKITAFLAVRVAGILTADTVIFNGMR